MLRRVQILNGMGKKNDAEMVVDELSLDSQAW